MKKSYAALIVLMGFIGVILASSSNIPVKEMSHLEEVANEPYVWQVSALLNEGDTIIVQINPRTGDDGWWRSLIRTPWMYLYLSISGPHDKTIYKVYYTASETTAPGSKTGLFGIPPDIGEFPISVLNYTLVKEGKDLEVRYEYLRGVKYIKEIACRVKVSGNYTVKIEHLNNWTWPRNEPDSLVILKEIHITVYPYKSLLPLGIAVLAFDGLYTCIIWRKNKSRIKSKPRRKLLSRSKYPRGKR